MKTKGYLKAILEKRGYIFYRVEKCIVKGELGKPRKQYITNRGLEAGI